MVDNWPNEWGPPYLRSGEETPNLWRPSPYGGVSDAPLAEPAGMAASRPPTAWEELQAFRHARFDHAHEVVADARNHRNVAVLRRALRIRFRA